MGGTLIKDKLEVIGSALMYDLFWYDCNYNGDGNGGVPRFHEKLFQQRCNSIEDLDVLIMDDTLDFDTIRNYSQSYISNNLNVGKAGINIEYHKIEPLARFIKSNFPNGLEVRSNYGRTEDLKKNMYFTLKASHVSWDTVHKKKTFLDLYLMSKNAGCQLIPELYHELLEFWESKFGKVWRADFTKEADDFFDDYVNKYIPHDDLHTFMISDNLDKPAFKYLQEPTQTTVYVDPIKFDQSTDYLKHRVIIEEAQVLALERRLLTNPEYSQRLAYEEFIEGLVDRLSPLWMTMYILNNFSFFIDYREDYFQKFKTNYEHTTGREFKSF
jgi:hypothetical protein